MKRLKLGWIMAAVGLLAGCQSALDRRIAAHQAAWRGLSEQDQQRLIRGYVRAGDTEEMVRIALGPPDSVLPITGPVGQRQTVWLYDLSEFGGFFFLNNLPNPPRLSDSEKNVIFCEGVVVDQVAVASGSTLASTARLKEIRIKAGTEHLVARLDRLVALTSEQRMKAQDIFTETSYELYAMGPDERPGKVMTIRAKMRTDIRAILAAEQQAKYDTAPQYLGGGATNRQ